MLRSGRNSHGKTLRFAIWIAESLLRGETITVLSPAGCSNDSLKSHVKRLGVDPERVNWVYTKPKSEPTEAESEYFKRLCEATSMPESLWAAWGLDQVRSSQRM